MAKFQYRLQNILNIKFKMEELAKQEFSAARQALDEEEAILSGLLARKQEYEDQARKLREGTLYVKRLEENKNAISTMERFVSAQRIRVAKAREHLEEARARMAEAVMERKTQEKLKENAFEEFLQEANRTERIGIDELTSYTYGQKQEG